MESGCEAGRKTNGSKKVVGLLVGLFVENPTRIPYRYEYPLVLAGNVKVYPDFTILKMPEREEVYLEHFGMMDDIDYVDSAMYKLSTYEKTRYILV